MSHAKATERETRTRAKATGGFVKVCFNLINIRNLSNCRVLEVILYPKRRNSLTISHYHLLLKNKM